MPESDTRAELLHLTRSLRAYLEDTRDAGAADLPARAAVSRAEPPVTPPASASRMEGIRAPSTTSTMPASEGRAPAAVPPAAAGHQAALFGETPGRSVARPASCLTVVEPTLPAGPHETLEEIRADLGECTRCKLHEARTNLVFGVGHPRATLMFVGEAPGRDEDQQGEPFVGAAGKLLTKIIEAIGFRREDVYIANVLKSRPPNNRDPEPDEISACSPFLFRQIASVSPRVMVTLGKWAAWTLIGRELAVSKMRGNWYSFRGIPVLPTYHPAYLLRNPAAKKTVWADMQKVMKEHARLAGGSGNA